MNDFGVAELIDSIFPVLDLRPCFARLCRTASRWLHSLVPARSPSVLPVHVSAPANSIETRSLPMLSRRGDLYVDHSHCPVLAPATLAALPSTRAIPDRDVFYVAHPFHSIVEALQVALAPAEPGGIPNEPRLVAAWQRPPTSFSGPPWRLRPVVLSSEPRCWFSPFAVPCASDSLSEICHP